MSNILQKLEEIEQPPVVPYKNDFETGFAVAMQMVKTKLSDNI